MSDPDAVTNTEPSIVVDHLTKRYGDIVAVDDLSFTIEPGGVTGFLGPNGAGKTTTMRAILGLITPTAGRATVLGRPYRQLEDPAGTVGALVEGAEDHPAMTARHSLRVRSAAAGISDTRVDKVLGLVGLTQAADRRVAGYSMGMRQRLGLARALLGDPDILVLDEPANGLDPDGVRWIRQLLRHLARQGRTVLVSSHILAEVAKLADQVLVIDKGRLITHRPVDQLTVDRYVVVRSPDADRFAPALRANGASVARIGSDALRVSGPDIEDVGRLAAQVGVVVFELRQEHVDLESVFLDMTGDHSVVGV